MDRCKYTFMRLVERSSPKVNSAPFFDVMFGSLLGGRVTFERYCTENTG